MGTANSVTVVDPRSPGALGEVVQDRGRVSFSVILFCEQHCPQGQLAWGQGRGAGLWTPASAVQCCHQLVLTLCNPWMRAVLHGPHRHTGKTLPPRQTYSEILGGLEGLLAKTQISAIRRGNEPEEGGQDG